MKKLDGSNNKPFPMKNLAKIRQEHGKTQRNLSVMLGFSQELISKYERGLANPSISSLKKIATFFNCSVDYLIDFTDNPSAHVDLSNEQSALISKYAQLSKDDKLLVNGYIDGLLAKNHKI